MMIISIFSIFLHPNKNILQAQNGVLDLSNWNFEKDGVISLDGNWEFYWNKLLTYEDFHKGEQIKPDGYFAVPDVWTNYTLNDKKIPSKGYATYRLRIKTKDIESLKGLKILTASTSYKLMINNKIVAQNGVVGKTKQSTVPQYKPQAVSFKNTSDNFEIIVQVSNYVYSRGGLWYSIYLGSDQEIRSLKEFNSGKEMFMIGVFMVMSLYHMTLFLLQKKNKSALYFALTLLITSIRIAVTGEYIILNLIPSATLNWMVPVEYMTMYWGFIMITIFSYELYPEEISKKVIKISIYIGTCISLFTVAAPIDVFTRYLIFYEFLIVCIYVYITFSLLRAVLKRREDAILVLSGIVIVIVIFIKDALYHWDIVYNKYGPSIEIAAFMFTFIQAYILAERFSRTFKKVEEMSEKLITLDKLKDEFLANTSHELRTPLNGIINITQSLLKGVAGKLNLSQEENLQIVVDSSKRLYNLINDILDISSLKNNELKLNPKPLDLRMVAETAIFVIGHLKKENNVIFQNHISKDIPAVFCDEERLYQIFYNIIGNALKFTEKGFITLEAKVSHNKVTIFINDTGIGIPEDKKESIFNAFEQADFSINRKYEGTGLGLFITKWLVELQGGEVGVESQEGKGSCFFFTFPIVEKKPENSMNELGKILELKDEKVEIPDDTDELDNYNILVVEDDAASRKALINNLRLDGYTVKAVLNGYDALKLLGNGIKFDIIILDIMMPGISGYDVVKRIREKYLPVELPVLMLTARSSIESISTGFKIGVNDYITKPFEPEELHARVNSLIQMKKAVKSLVDTELSFLQAQIKPHFIYNALSVISSLSIREPVKAKELILDLSDYLRGSFDFESREGNTTLKKELDIVRAYLSIEQARFRDRLCVEFIVDDVDCTIPMLCVQPLVENAVRHGIMPMLEGGKIYIVVLDKGNYARISVIDNGLGIDEKKAKSLLSGEVKMGSVGLKNIHKRLIALYGKGLTITRGEEKGTKVEFIIPYTVNRGD
ncbi:response regulator [Clostridium sp. PL3]|uniref:Circadian input-output histidine kinase CikA n=1 Tax=Clostridium thailandense TaxID=2794346 RepID=A0A949U1D8_9CLOT|nr:ATP-binding protein [Clostridium thailandense]MBV7274514.1 response regulator [Clostridium thailandense]